MSRIRISSVFPKFARALKHARVAEPRGGRCRADTDLWWHQIDALDAFNVLVNYWWRQSPAFMDSSPFSALLLLTLMTVLDLPPAQRTAWQRSSVIMYSSRMADGGASPSTPVARSASRRRIHAPCGPRCLHA